MLAELSEDIENELEALRSIYGEDFEERPPVWKRPCFCIRVKPTTSTSGAIHVEATLKFTLVNGYPKVPAKVEVESHRGLSGSDAKELNNRIQASLAEHTGDVMCHEVIAIVQQFLESNNVKPQSFYEAMVSREKREKDALKDLRAKDASSDGIRQSQTALPKPAPLTGKFSDTGAINVSAQSDASLLESASTLDFKQSTEFISQQRLLSKASKRGKQPGSPRSQQPSTISGKAGTTSSSNLAGIDNSDSLNISSLNASINNPSLSNPGSAAGQSSRQGRSTKSWAKLFLNQTEDEDSGNRSDSSPVNSIHRKDTAGATQAKASSQGAVGGVSAGVGSVGGGGTPALVPVIGRTLPTATADNTASRYAQEFHELSQLGTGASGQVWKVRNKLDRRIYAVKKIDLNAAENASVGQAKIRREVTTISRLLHKHIVRYYAAWVEETACSGVCEGGGDGGNGSESCTSATLTFGGASVSESPSARSSSRRTLGRGSNNANSSSSGGRSGAPEYLSAVLGTGGNKGYTAYGSNGQNKEDDGFTFMYNQNPEELWTFGDDTESSAEGAPKPLSSPYAVVPKAGKTGSRFFSYGDTSSDDDGSDSDEDSTSSDSDSSDPDESSSSDESSVVGPTQAKGKTGIAADKKAANSGIPGGSGSSASASASTGADGKSTGVPRGPSGSPPEAKAGSSRRHIPRATSAGPKMRRWMFIQMEYCYTTLREVIDQGQLWQQPAECGKLLRQVLEALVYIHDRRVIHRDLKPANIFLDAEGNIKIGDFGLATFTADDSSGAKDTKIGASTSEPNLYNLSLRGASEDDKLATMSRETSNLSLAHLDTDALSNSLTGGIGTAMYRAPEQEYRPKDTNGPEAAVGYDEKADMFSLGVILFEMCHPPFGTGMERLLVMKRLRDNAELPPGFGTDYSTEAMATIVRWLVQRQPSQRPTAAQLLASPLVPARVDTDARYLREITEALWKPNSSAAMNIISVLFNNSINVQKPSTGPVLPASGSGKSAEGQLGSPLPQRASGLTAFTRAMQDSMPAVSYDLDVLQQSLNALQPRKVPRSITNHWFLAMGPNATKAAKLALRQELHKERAVVTLQYSTALKRRLCEVFEAHGAVQYSPGLLQLRNNPGLALMMRNADRAVARLHGKPGAECVPGSTCTPALAQFLDPVGQVVVLPTDLVTPFAKLVAFLNLQHSQRYNISQVYTSLVPPDSPTIEDTPVVAGHDHPFISEEAVYDVVLPYLPASTAPSESVATSSVSEASQEQSAVLRADFEVLSAAIEAMSKFQPFLPDCAIRVTDPRLMDSIIELCALDLHATEAGAATLKPAATSGTAPPGANAAAATGASAGSDQYDRESLFKIISLASDGILTPAEVTRLITELHTPAHFQKRLLAFVPVFCAVQDRRAAGASDTAGSSGSYLQQGLSANSGRDPLMLLDALEQEFYRCEVIVDIQRRLASGTTATTASTAAHSAKAAEKILVAAATEKVPAVSDFRQLNLDHIGKKQSFIGKKGATGLGAAASERGGRSGVTSAAPAGGAASKGAMNKAASADKAQAEDDPFREERKRIRMIIKTFDGALTHLRALIKAGLNCLYGIQQHSVAAAAGAGSGLGIGGSSNLLLIVDLGKDPRYISSRAGSSMLCPFHARGVYFVIESYLFPSEQYLEQQLQQHHKKADKKQPTKQASAKEKGLSAQDPALLLRCCRRRHNRFGGVLGEAGHFEHLVDAYREHFTQAGGSDQGAAGRRPPGITACALRLKLDVIAQLITKYETRQRRIADNVLVRGNTHKYHFGERFRNNISDLLDSASSLDALLAVDASSTRELTAATAAALQSVLLLLRRHGIRVSDRPHQLQGASQGFQQHLDPPLAATLCAELGVPFAVVLHPEAGNKITLQYCGDAATSSAASPSAQQQQQVAAVSLLDLPRVLQECIRVHQVGEGKFSLQIAVSVALGESTGGPRSPGRGNATGSGTGGSSAAASGMGAGGEGGNAGGAGKNQRVRFGSFDIKNPSVMAVTSSEGTLDSPPTVSSRVAHEKIVHVVALDTSGAATMGHGKDWQQYSNPKEKKQAVIKKKEYEQAPQRIRALMSQAYSIMMLLGSSGSGTNDAAVVPNFTPLNRSYTAPYVPGVVVLVDLPFALLRDLCTILMTRLHNQLACVSARTEYEALPTIPVPDSPGYTNSAGNNVGAYRKTLKQLMALLISYAKQVTTSGGSGGIGVSNVSERSSAGSGGGKGGGSGSTTPSATAHAHGGSTGTTGASDRAGGSGTGASGAGAHSLLQVHLYSVGDQQMDMLVCDARALLGAKLA